MKKVVLSLGVVAALAMTSCGGINVQEAADEFCACAEKEGDDKDACHDEWVEKYKGSRGTEEQGKELGTKMAECDPGSALSVLSKMAE